MIYLSILTLKISNFSRGEKTALFLILFLENEFSEIRQQFRPSKDRRPFPGRSGLHQKCDRRDVRGRNVYQQIGR